MMTYLLLFVVMMIFLLLFVMMMTYLLLNVMMTYLLLLNMTPLPVGLGTAGAMTTKPLAG